MQCKVAGAGARLDQGRHCRPWQGCVGRTQVVTLHLKTRASTSRAARTRQPRISAEALTDPTKSKKKGWLARGAGSNATAVNVHVKGGRVCAAHTRVVEGEGLGRWAQKSAARGATCRGQRKCVCAHATRCRTGGSRRTASSSFGEARLACAAQSPQARPPRGGLGGVMRTPGARHKM